MLFSAELFMLFEPLMTPESIQFANGSDGRGRRKAYDPVYSHESVRQYYDTFYSVRQYIWLFFKYAMINMVKYAIKTVFILY